jgi:hypothetical protein
LPRKGEHLSEEAKKKLSQARKGKKFGAAAQSRFLEGRGGIMKTFSRFMDTIQTKEGVPRQDSRKATPSGSAVIIPNPQRRNSPKPFEVSLQGHSLLKPGTECLILTWV